MHKTPKIQSTQKVFLPTCSSLNALWFRLSVCLYFSLYLSLSPISVCLCICLSVCLPVCLSLCLTRFPPSIVPSIPPSLPPFPISPCVSSFLYLSLSASSRADPFDWLQRRLPDSVASNGDCTPLLATVAVALTYHRGLQSIQTGEDRGCSWSATVAPTEE